MSIENGITKLADAIATIAQSGFALAASIDRYCDIAQADRVTAVEDIKAYSEVSDIISKGVADFEKEFETHQAQSEAAPVEGEAVEPAPIADSEPVTFDEARAIVVSTVAKQGKAKVSAIFKQLGAAKLTDLEPSQFNELVALCKAA